MTTFIGQVLNVEATQGEKDSLETGKSHLLPSLTVIQITSFCFLSPKRLTTKEAPPPPYEIGGESVKIPEINIKLPIPANNTLWLQTFLDTSDSSRKSIQYPKMSNLYTTGSIQVFQAPCPQPVSAQHHHALA